MLTPELKTRIEKAVANNRSLLTLSADDTLQVCLCALRAHEMLTDIRSACDAAARQKFALNPEGLQAFIDDNKSPFNIKAKS